MGSVSLSDDSGSPVKRRNAVTSRRKKSKDQIEILERLYAENKYPSEEVRAKLSLQLGLSEKQMQIWFTHRRHKDRKDGVEDVKLTFYAMRHKGGEAHLDFMEGLNSGKVPGGSLGGSDNSGGRQPSYSGGEVNTGQQRMLVDSRRVDSESENSGLGQSDDCHTNGFSKPSLKRASTLNRKDGIYKRPMTVPPSRAKVQAKDLEVAVISAVEAQLGESLRVDGPTLGMEFDSLPPGAWEHLSQAGVTVPVAVQWKGPIVSQGRIPVPVPVQSRATASGRVPMGVQGRVGRIQSVGTY